MNHLNLQAVVYGITLPSGAVYQSFWGGHLRKAYTSKTGVVVGESCAVRIYHELTKCNVNGIDWIKSYREDPNFPNSHHLEYKSTCGKYKISEYYENYIENKVFYPFKCSTWRKDMASTFGHYLEGRRITCKTFEGAAEIVAKYAAERL